MRRSSPSKDDRQGGNSRQRELFLVDLISLKGHTEGFGFHPSGSGKQIF